MAREYYFLNHNIVELKRIGKSIQTYIVEPRSESLITDSDKDQNYEESSEYDSDDVAMKGDLKSVG